MTYFILERSVIQMNSNPSSDRSSFVRAVNNIPNFGIVFDRLEVGPIEADNADRTWRLFAAKVLSNQTLRFLETLSQVINRLITICIQYGHAVSLIVKFIDNGSFLAYYIVERNIFIDFTKSINQYLEACEQPFGSNSP